MRSVAIQSTETIMSTAGSMAMISSIGNGSRISVRRAGTSRSSSPSRPAGCRLSSLLIRPRARSIPIATAFLMVPIRPFDTPVDSDDDGLPDLDETQTGSSPTNPDSDGDGWHDGRNRRTFLLLARIQCRDEDEDVGHDEVYLVAEDVRFPEEAPLHGYWEMNRRYGSLALHDSRLPGPRSR